MSVAVLDGQGQGIANATVVIGNEAGVMDSFLRTNAAGEAAFVSMPANATITAVSSCYSSSADRTYYFVNTTYHANGAGLAVTLGTCSENDIDQQVDITVTSALAGVASTEATIGAITYGGPSATMDFSSGLQDDGTFSVFASGYDAAGNILGYGFALDQPAVASTGIEVVIDRTDLVRNSHSLVDVPANTLSYYAAASLIRKHGTTNLPYNFTFGMAPIPATVTTYAADNFSDGHLIFVTAMADRDNDTTADAEVGFMRHLPVAADQIFDFSTTPLVPAALAWEPGAGGRPTISWANADPLATANTVGFSYRPPAPERSSYYYTLTAPASVTSLVFPELPDELAAYRPAAYDNLSLVTMRFDSPIDYNGFLAAVNAHGDRFYEAEGLERQGYARVSLLP